ncbi:MAG: penicillin-binding protein 2, partial [Treponema sp.]|nr:penicillin-binding protein 2 [Treponema sp.]
MQNNEFQNIGDDSTKKNIKIVFLTAFIAVIFVIYVLKLFSLQIIESYRYKDRSERISKQETVIPAQRGEIYEREAMIPLASNSDSFAVNVVPGEIPPELYDTVITRLAGYIGVPRKSIDAKIKKRDYSSYEIKTNVSFDVISNIAENITELPGVSWRNKPVRTYVNMGSISHILGYVGNITEDEYKRMYNEGYKKNSVIGKAGIERQYDSYLQGKEGLEVRTKDARGRILGSAPQITPPQTGKKLVLTIDNRIQELAEKTLGQRVGAVVVLRPSNGEILAMVSYPYYNANIFSTDEYAAEYNRLTT